MAEQTVTEPQAHIGQVGDLYTLDQAAKALDITYSMVYRRVRKGKVPTYRLGRSMLVRLQDIRV